MFSEKDKSYLKDIVQHSEYARSYVKGMSQSDFMTDTKTVHAVERCISIVGEAANKLSPDAIGAIPDIPWTEIRGIRNRVIHDYGMVNLDIIWNIVQYELTTLINTCSKTLNEEK